MASEIPGTGFNVKPVPDAKSPTTATAGQPGGKGLPGGGLNPAVVTAKSQPSSLVKAPQQPAVKPVATPAPDINALVAQLNKHLQSSGRPNTYRLDSSTGRSVIQEINPDTNQVVSELPASEFKALAQELGVSGLLVDTRA